MANTLNAVRGGAVGFIEWLGGHVIWSGCDLLNIEDKAKRILNVAAWDSGVLFNDLAPDSEQALFGRRHIVHQEIEDRSRREAFRYESG